MGTGNDAGYTFIKENNNLIRKDIAIFADTTLYTFTFYSFSRKASVPLFTVRETEPRVAT